MLNDPEQHQTRELGNGEQVHLSQGNVPQVDEVWLVLRRHTKQFQTVEELKSGEDESRCLGG